MIGNMVKDALEATLPRQTVTAGCRERHRAVEFWVHDAAFLPEGIQLQIFGRSFSTRGGGRGLGTNSIKLLTERYLGGAASSPPTPDEGPPSPSGIP